MSWIDWTIMAVAVVSLRFVSLSSRRYMKGVADFLSANRSAGRYLLTIAGQMGGTGAISVVAFFVVYFGSGLPPIWWDFMNLPIGAFVILTGWVYYRYRETRAMTLAQFLEMRYSRNFRIFAGLICWACGILNFGIFPAVTARFFIYFCGLPDHIGHFLMPTLGIQMHGLSCSLHPHLFTGSIPTIAPIMAVDLGLALTFVTMGGQISVMVTECAQGMVSAVAFIVIVAAVLVKISWPQILHAMTVSAPANASLLHPFHTGDVQTYNVWYYVIGAFGTLYGMCSWQGSAGFMTSGRSAHEQKMGQVIAVWRELPLRSMYIILPIAAFAVMKLPEFTSIAHAAGATLNGIDNQQIRTDMTTPIVLAHFLPVGIKGLFATVMLFFSFTCHDTYMHSWGSMLVQDVVIPWRNRPLDQDRHVRWLRWSVIFVALFGFFFSLLWSPKMDILMFFAITGTIWAGGSGAVIIGGLYWKKGTTPAAYASLILGAIVGVGGLIVSPWYQARFHHPFPMNQQWLFMLSMLGAPAVYIIISLMTHRSWLKRILITLGITAAISYAIGLGLHSLGVTAFLAHQDVIVRRTVVTFAIILLYVLVCLAVCRDCEHEFNLDRMLHRGRYSDKTSEELAKEAHVSPWQKLLGITSEFTTGDKVMAMLLLVWQLGWSACFVVVSVINLASPGTFPISWWAHFWHLYLMSLFVLGIPITVWFTIGGVLDIKMLFRILSNPERDATDDGRVVHEPEEIILTQAAEEGTAELSSEKSE
jgi:SSS family solute:Na+ symporter